MPDFIPAVESELITYSNKFQNGIADTNAAALGLTTPQSTNFASLNLAWTNSYVAATTEMTRTPVTLNHKNECKAAMISDLRMLAGIIQKNPATTNDQRIALGLTVHSGPSPIGVPTTGPKITVRSTSGRTIELQLSDSEPGSKRSKPVGALGAQIYSYTGTTPPDDVNAWTFQGICRRSIVSLTLPNTVAGGSQVFFTGCWFNERMQTGPNTTPISCFIAGGSVSKSA